MKIMQINVVYKRGSTGKIIDDIHDTLKGKGYDSIICYGRGQKEKEINVYKTSSEVLAKLNALRSRITGLQYNGSWFATKKLIRIIKKEQPDVVHLHCINGDFVNIYRLFDFLKKNRFKTVLTLHAEFMHTGNCGHALECDKWMTGCGNCPQLKLATKSYFWDRTHNAWLRMKKSFEGFDDLKIISVSQWLEDRAKQSPIMKGHHFQVIKNGIDTKEIFYPRDFQYIKEKFGIKDEKILLHVTASFTLKEDDIKGGHYIVKLAERLENKNIKIFVIGGLDQSIELPENIINIGRVTNQHELAAYYSMADLTILTSKKETFSMVCAESLSCGTPVVGFKAGGPETIALKEYSEFVEYGNIELLESSLNAWIDFKAISTSSKIQKEARGVYSKEKMISDYLNKYNEFFEF